MVTGGLLPQPEVDRLAGGRLEGGGDPLAAGGGLCPAAYPGHEVGHLLEVALRPDLLEAGPGPAARAGRLLQGVAVAVLAVGGECGAAGQVGPGPAAPAVD